MTEDEARNKINEGLGVIYDATLLFIQIVGMDRAAATGMIDEELASKINGQYAMAIQSVSDTLKLSIEESHELVMHDYCRVVGILGTDEEKEIREKYSLKPQQQD